MLRGKTFSQGVLFRFYPFKKKLIPVIVLFLVKKRPSHLNEPFKVTLVSYVNHLIIEITFLQKTSSGFDNADSKITLPAHNVTPFSSPFSFTEYMGEKAVLSLWVDSEQFTTTK